MIPQHLINEAAQALYERDCKDYYNNGGTEHRHPWHETAVFTTQRPYKKRATAALTPVAAHLWDQGWKAGYRYQTPADNPYRNETT